MKLDILAIGVHPDDVELSCAGTLLVQKSLGHTTGILDLTQGELGTRGTPQLRLKEAEAAAKILNVDIRVNLAMQDGFFNNDKEHQLKIISVLRKYQPDIVLANAITDRHPDHGRSATLANDACFLSGLRKIETQDENGNFQQAWRPRLVLHYVQDRLLTPNIIVDISPYINQKIDSIKAYKSQFYNPNSDEPETYISSKAFLDNVIARNREYGRPCGFEYAEGFTSAKFLGVKDLNHLF